MRVRWLLIAAAAVVGPGVVPATADVTPIAVQALPNDRQGVVLKYRERSKTAVVALRSGKLLTIHALRKVSPGSRVRVGGIKWGTPTPGIKWGTPGSGIKWGIKWGKSGTYSSSLTRLGTARTTALRGVVVRKYRGGVAVGVRGGVVGVRMAVWLPKRGNEINGLGTPEVGDSVLVTVRFGKQGRLVGTRGQVLNLPRARVIPFAGRLSAISTQNRTMRVSNRLETAFQLEQTMSVPTSVDMARLQLGREVAVTAEVASDGSLRAKTIAPNDSFTAANNPANQIVVPPAASSAVLDLIRSAILQWDAGRVAGGIPDEALYLSNAAHLASADVAARDGAIALAIAELNAFLDAIRVSVPTKVTPPVAANGLALATAAVELLVRGN